VSPARKARLFSERRVFYSNGLVCGFFFFFPNNGGNRDYSHIVTLLNSTACAIRIGSVVIGVHGCCEDSILQ
jgi:hypothetical protein